MHTTTRVRMEWKSLWFCATLGAAAAMSQAQTPSNAIFIHQYHNSGTYSEYVDLDASGKSTFNPDNTFPRYVHSYDFHERASLAVGLCYEIGFLQQIPTPIPDWTLWIETSQESWNFAKVSDNFGGTLFPRLRIWSKGNNDMRIVVASKVNAASGNSSGAAWITQTVQNLSQAACESGGMAVVRLSQGANPYIVRYGS